MTVEIPTSEPDVIIAGDTLKFTKDLPDYLPADSWVLTYALVKYGTQIKITATDNGDGTHLVNVAIVTTGAYAVGDYQWHAYVTKSGERYTVGKGRVKIKTDFAGQASGFDGRSHAQVMLDAIEARLQGRATDNQLDIISTALEGRSITRETTAELIKLRSFYKIEFKKEKQAENLNKGLDAGGRILTRFK